jgi:hypothetical protein
MSIAFARATMLVDLTKQDLKDHVHIIKFISNSIIEIRKEISSSNE